MDYQLESLQTIEGMDNLYSRSYNLRDMVIYTTG